MPVFLLDIFHIPTIFISAFGGQEYFPLSFPIPLGSSCYNKPQFSSMFLPVFFWWNISKEDSIIEHQSFLSCG
jgi:hypothetical protein